VEPIQGEKGVYVPDDDYIGPAPSPPVQGPNVLFIADEVQTGIARTGRLLASCHHHGCDCTASGSCKNGCIPQQARCGDPRQGPQRRHVCPCSAVLADDAVMIMLHPPAATAAPSAATPGLRGWPWRPWRWCKDEKLAENAEAWAGCSAPRLQKLVEHPMVSVVRGKGLLNAIVIQRRRLTARPPGMSAWLLKDNGLLAKPTHDHIIRFAPPLVITEEQLGECLGIIETTLEGF
jgi:ornithine--oxo-acid transaminase